MNEILVCNECAKLHGFATTDRVLDHEEFCVICGKMTSVNFSREELAAIIKYTVDNHKVILENPPLISVIIAVKDRVKSFRNTLWSWGSQNYPFQEYIIVDDGSQDMAGIAAAVAEANLPNWQLIRIDHPGDRSPARPWNEGFKHVKGDFIVVTGCDLILSTPNLLTMMYRQYHGARRISVLNRWLDGDLARYVDILDWKSDPTIFETIPGFWSGGARPNLGITAAGIHTYCTGQSIREWEWMGKFVDADHYMAADTNLVHREQFLGRGCDTLMGACTYHQDHKWANVPTDAPVPDYDTVEKARLLV